MTDSLIVAELQECFERDAVGLDSIREEVFAYTFLRVQRVVGVHGNRVRRSEGQSTRQAIVLGGSEGLHQALRDPRIRIVHLTPNYYGVHDWIDALVFPIFLLSC